MGSIKERKASRSRSRYVDAMARGKEENEIVHCCLIVMTFALV